VGDTITIRQFAGDDNGLAWLVWELGAPANVRDSVPFTGSAERDVGRIVVRPEWVGTAELRVWATDMAGNRSTVYSSGAGGVEIIPLAVRPVRHAHVAAWVTDVAADPARGRLYVAGAGGVTVVSLADVSTITRYPVVGATTLDLTASGDTLLVGADSILTVIDLAHSTQSSVRLAKPRLEALRVAANGKVLGSVHNASSSSLVGIDPATGAMTVRADDAGSFTLADLVRSADRSVLVYSGACARVYTAATDAVSGCTDVARLVTHFSVDDRGTLFVRGGALLGPGFAPIRSIGIDGGLGDGLLFAGAASPDGSYGYVSAPEGLLKVRADGKLLERTPLPMIYGRMIFTPDGATLVAANESGLDPGTIFVVDLR
jgi:hypothetical protein